MRFPAEGGPSTRSSEQPDCFVASAPSLAELLRRAGGRHRLGMGGQFVERRLLDTLSGGAIDAATPLEPAAKQARAPTDSAEEPER